MSFRQLLWWVLFLFANGQAFPQVKYEKEYRLAEKKVPDRALHFLESLPVPGKVRWYAEEGISRHTVEAKFRISEKRYSVEFDSLGNLEDVELLASPDAIPGPALEKLQVHWSSECRDYRIRKVQIQFTGDAAMLRETIITHIPPPQVRVSYEIVYSCRSAGHVRMFEITTGNDGTILRREEILPINTDNLED